MSACDRCVKPSAGALLLVETISASSGDNDGEGYSSAESAYDVAIGNLPEFSEHEFPLDNFVQAEITSFGPTYFEARVMSGRYRLGGWSGTGYLKIWWDLVTREDGEEVDRVRDDVTFEFTTDPATGFIIPGNSESIYDGNPDITHKHVGEPPSPIFLTLPYEATFEADAREIVSPMPAEPVFIDVAVATTASIDVQIAKFSCIPGYEPDISDPENPQPNGYPDPTWEAAAP